MKQNCMLLSYVFGCLHKYVYGRVSKSLRTGHLKRELQMVQVSATRCSFITIL